MEALWVRLRLGFKVGIKPTTAFAAQRAWIQNATLRDNILCGYPFNKPRYDDVISACALEPDIKLLAAGDLTELGERGINLSGGQKQRINVARALYSWCQVVLLDDPFSALDAHVSRDLFENGILGFLKRDNRTVVLVTNETQYLRHADKVIVLKAGAITHHGEYETVTKEDEQLAIQWSQLHHDGQDIGPDKDNVERKEIRKQIEKFEFEENDGKLVEAEEMADGSVLMSVYLFLIKSTSWLMIAVIMSYGVEGAFFVSQHLWMAYWIKDNYQPVAFNGTSALFQTRSFIIGYGSLSSATIFFNMLTQSLYVISAIVLGITLHKKMITNVTKLPMRFFDTNPVGRILNRFSSDLEIIDMKLFRTMDASMATTWRLIFSFVGLIFVLPIFTFVVTTVFVIFCLIQRFYLRTSRQLRRLESVSKSALYSHATETMDGISTIRAYRYQRRFFLTFLDRMNVNATAYLYQHSLRMWLNVRLDALAAITGLIAGLITILSADSLHPALIGFAISYAFKDIDKFGYLIRHLSNLEIQMNAVERVKHYVDLPTEDFEGNPPPDEWPKHGSIAFENVSVQYDDTGPVLHDVNLTFSPREKIGICGRTGSGKSTLALSLFRCNNVCKGTIWIDGIDIHEVPLTTLRQRLSIIPQEPVLFMGSIRKNLDPEGNRSDQELWHALDIVQLTDKVVELDGALDAMVSDGGDNFSVGQQQLICLARAYLRKSRVLIMDEPTASVDKETSKVLQDLLSSAFVDRTVLSIAHRVHTIMDSNTIVVMDGGNVVESGTPKNLIAKEHGFFSSIYKSACEM
ncbi:ATP-binding cassette sub-family C member 9-like [Amphiura filiformis]|uniref:ATP-binding cassette sub-family C member 9-like n=1 Tax=Amphiura filiformis TaxID=82378 RepID=UPI003B222AD1